MALENYSESLILDSMNVNARSYMALTFEQLGKMEYAFQVANDGYNINPKNAFVNYQIDLKSDNTYKLKYRPFNLSDYLETGNWAFSNDKVFINFTPKDSKSPGQWKILRLTETETWVIQNINGKDVELRMKD